MRDELAVSEQSEVARGSTARTALAPDPAGPIDFATLYQTRFHDVCRWLRALGGPTSDLDDLAQEVFIVVRRKLPEFDGRNPSGWLYRIAARTLSDHRRRVWFRQRLRWSQDVELSRVAQRGPDAAEQLERDENERILYQLLDKMNATRREVFILFELECLGGEEIARLLGIPLNTVWTRLSRARSEFQTIATRYRKQVGAA